MLFAFALLALLCGSVAVEARTHTHAHHPQLLASQTFDVTTYGALGDGVTDDSAAVAKAASAMEACNCIGTLYFPAGHFVLNNSYDGGAGDAIIALRTPGQYTILGAGVDATILRWDSLTAELIQVGTTPNERSARPVADAAVSFTAANFTIVVDEVPITVSRTSSRHTHVCA